MAALSDLNVFSALTIASLLTSSDYIFRDRSVVCVGEDQAPHPLSRPPPRSAVAHRSSEETNFKERWFDDGYSVSYDQKSRFQMQYSILEDGCFRPSGITVHYEQPAQFLKMPSQNQWILFSTFMFHQQPCTMAGSGAGWWGVNRLHAYGQGDLELPQLVISQGDEDRPGLKKEEEESNI